MTCILSNTYDDLINKYPILKKHDYQEILDIFKNNFEIK